MKTRLPVSKHGTRALYNRRKNPCRCGICRAANQRYQDIYRKRRKRGW